MPARVLQGLAVKVNEFFFISLRISPFIIFCEKNENLYNKQYLRIYKEEYLKDIKEIYHVALFVVTLKFVNLFEFSLHFLESAWSNLVGKWQKI